MGIGDVFAIECQQVVYLCQGGQGDIKDALGYFLRHHATERIRFASRLAFWETGISNGEGEFGGRRMGPVAGALFPGGRMVGPRPGKSTSPYGLEHSTGDSSPGKTCPWEGITG